MKMIVAFSETKPDPGKTLLFERQSKAVTHFTIAHLLES